MRRDGRPLVNNVLTEHFADGVKSKLMESQMYFCLTGMFTESYTKSIFKLDIDQKWASWHGPLSLLIVRDRHPARDDGNGRFEATVIQF